MRTSGSATDMNRDGREGKEGRGGAAVGNFTDRRLPPSFQREVTIEPGFSISIMDFSITSPLSFSYDRNKPMINFGFVLSGNFINTITSSGLAFDNKVGHSGILYLRRQKGHLEFFPGTPVRVLHIHLAPKIIHELFAGEPDTLPKQLARILDQSPGRPYSYRAGIERQMYPVLLKAFEGPVPGTPERMFYQAVALDLIAGQVAKVNTRDGGTLPGGPCRSERDRVVEAAGLLTGDLVSPPPLHELAGLVGLNRNKLQQGFRKMFGVSVYKYLSRCRMQEAYRLFCETDMNVSQAASAVGYSNYSHFSRAYDKVFGILPKKHLLEIKRGDGGS